MIVWGGAGDLGSLNTGGKYNPLTNNWTATTTANAPVGRYYHSGVWTGSEMIVWGGYDGMNDLNTGGKYNPTTNTWAATNTANAPSARQGHTAVWTGNQLIVWGGIDQSSFTVLDTGGRYNASTNSWIGTDTSNAPSARMSHTAVWTGVEMIVWGGGGKFQDFDTGSRYNPTSDSWTNISAPSERESHTVVWTGTEMIVWGGVFQDSDYHFLNTGGRYNPSIDSWLSTSITNTPSARRATTQQCGPAAR